MQDGIQAPQSEFLSNYGLTMLFKIFRLSSM
jgi:hypothetical protein